MGLKGSQEVKDHVWLKYYPWKDLYDKTLASPFNPKVGDNFDSKYCNAVEKIGQQTKDRYDSIMREENNKASFLEFYFYFNECDLNDRNNNKELKFFNPHTSLVNNKKQEIMPNSRSGIDFVRSTSPSNFESRLNKIKILSSSASNNSLFSKARQMSSINNNSTTGGTGSCISSNNSSSVFKKSSSLSNFKY